MENQKEIWKDVPDFEGFYQASTSGRIRSVDRIIRCWNGKLALHKGKLLKQIPDVNGYLCVQFSVFGKPKKFRSNRIIAITFIPNIDNKLTVNHDNGIKTDNRVANLTWMSHSENSTHSFRVLGRKPPKGVSNKYGKDKRMCKPINQFSKSGEFIKSYESIHQAGISVNVCPSNISKAIRGILKTSGGYIWKFA